MKLLIIIENSNQNTLKKVLDIIKQLENNYYEICIQRSNIPSNSVEITDISSLTSECKRKYKRFINRAKNQKYYENPNTSKTQKNKLKQTQKNHQILQNQGQINLISQNKQLNQDDEQINKENQVKKERDLEMNQQKVQEKNIISKVKYFNCLFTLI
ncbi:unnamed protein product [Paramecium primaurelia]|uniref:Uncharacterized protein n=1 Tax=Paramecium primaurelia TaxID=5886 RepID=A0A8S1NI02_PARPR|nr:unnamed protein product [Paramecium primaurelia]